ncbi:MAG: hypothetical protein ACI4SS_04220 [Clostridia bacterium]
MKSRERKVIVLKNLNSPEIEQALFILKDDSDGGTNAVFEAERIIEEYIFPSSPPPPSRRDKLNLDFLPFAVTAAIAVLAGAAAIVVNVL